MNLSFVIECPHVFWEIPCPDCGKVVTESVAHDAAACEECGKLVKVDVDEPDLRICADAPTERIPLPPISSPSAL